MGEGAKRVLAGFEGSLERESGIVELQRRELYTQDLLKPIIRPDDGMK